MMSSKEIFFKRRENLYLERNLPKKEVKIFKNNFVKERAEI